MNQYEALVEALKIENMQIEICAKIGHVSARLSSEARADSIIDALTKFKEN